MKKDFLEILSCPQCLGILKLNEKIYDERNIFEGTLNCLNCKLNFEIKDGVPIFGLRLDDKEERLNEIEAENEWTFAANDIQEHERFAKTSSRKGIELIEFIKSFDENLSERKNILDIGSGWGCFQAWQFAKRDYNVTAIDICPEFIFASENVARDCYFERIVTDCTTLPFKDQSFDIIYCKETLHHINHPAILLDELWRVCSPNGLILIKEPCISLLQKKLTTKRDDAKKIGISHHFRMPKEYIRLMQNITNNSRIECKSSIFPRILHDNTFSDYVNKIMIHLWTCELKMVGTKRAEYRPKVPINRNVIPIKIDKLNRSQIDFYKKKLIPIVFNCFK